MNLAARAAEVLSGASDPGLGATAGGVGELSRCHILGCGGRVQVPVWWQGMGPAEGAGPTGGV